MLVMLGEDGDEHSRTFLARPVFNKFQPVTEAILHQIAALKVRAHFTPHRSTPHRTVSPRTALSSAPSRGRAMVRAT